MYEEENEKSWVYIIDENFHIVYSNDDLKATVPDAESGQPCYQMICQENSQCKKCPLRKENRKKSILYNCLHNKWVSVSTSTIDWPGVGKCYMLLCNDMEDNSQNFFFDTAGQSEYNELLELNYLNDSYNIIYHSKKAIESKNLGGSIRDALHQIAETQIIPDDRERFYNFWRIDRIGNPGIPDEMFVPRHGEFRKQNPDGHYSWFQQILIPTKRSTQDSVFVISFYNNIGMPNRYINENIDYGIHNKQNFFKHISKFLKYAADDTSWCIVSLDIEKFKLFNEWYGHDAGNTLLSSISDCLKQLQNQKYGTAGYIGDDNFAFFMPYDEGRIKELCDIVNAQIKLHSEKMNVLPAFGIFQITDTKDSVYKMYDRAKLACSSVKGNYITRIKKFDSQMLESIQSELLLLADIQNAFQRKEFTFVLQPKCNMRNGKIVGAEALARWYNDEKGFISPGVFIPFLEKSGLVSALDTYIWEEVCRWQRSMLDRGYETLPVSVNISRMDICFLDVPAYFNNLIKKYDLNPKLIELEITESAYSENMDVINRIVTELQNSGFRVLMDDFGSAYSSLNMLKDISLDVIKMDMRFLQLNGANASRGIDILETVCNMAHVLGLDIIAEGIETEEQKNFLLKAGCYCGQGYYFYRPLTISDFEKTIEAEDSLCQAYLADEPTELFYLKDLVNQNILNQNMLNNMLGAVAFYDVCDHKIQVVRYNEQYAKILGNETNSAETRMDFGAQLYEEEYEKIFEMFANAQKNRYAGSETDIRRRRPDGTDMWLHLRVFFLYQRDGHSIFYSTVTDVTEVFANNLVLEFLNNDMPGGYYRHKNNIDGDFTHISQRFLDIFGFTREEIKSEFDDKFLNMVHPEDRESVRNSIESMEQTGGNYSQPCRMRSKNGYIFVVDQSRLVHFGNKEIFQGIIFCNLDHYMWLKDDGKNVEQDDNTTTLMPCGVFRSEADDQHRFSYISNSMLHMLGYSRHDFTEKFNNTTDNMVYEGDRARITNEIADQIKTSNFTACEYRIEMADGSLKWVYSRGRLTTDRRGKRWFYACITDYDYLKEKYQIQEWQHSKYKTLIEIPGMIVYDYDPQFDRLSLEMSKDNGEIETVVAENYIENIGKHNFIAQEHVDEQRQLLLDAVDQPLSGTTEFLGHFAKERDLQWYRFHYTSLADENGKVYRIVGRGENITEEKSKFSIWEHRATKDALTGLLNYESAKTLANEVLDEHTGGTLLLLDVDNFKDVNDTLGHLAGDELLKNIAEIIQSSFRREDISARFGGDEFFIFMPGALTQETMASKAQEFLEKMSDIHLENLHAQCSIGIASADNSTNDFDELFQQADTALYQSKRGGKNKYTFFTV